MGVTIIFKDGPMDKMRARSVDLPQLQLFFDTRQKQVFCYKRVSEVDYVFLFDISKQLSEKYDVAFNKFGGKGNSVESWENK